jgi:cytochrome c-type biogenesis protein CcmF
MLTEIGHIATLLAFITALYAIAASVIGETRRAEHIVISGRNAALLVSLMLTVASVALQIALMTEQYQNTYVWSVSSPSMPSLFRWTALWGSQKGSLLFWSFLMSLFTTGTILVNWRSHRRLMPYSIAFMMAVVAFFVGLTLFLENPLSAGGLCRKVTW